MGILRVYRGKRRRGRKTLVIGGGGELSVVISLRTRFGLHTGVFWKVREGVLYRWAGTWLRWSWKTKEITIPGKIHCFYCSLDALYVFNFCSIFVSLFSMGCALCFFIFLLSVRELAQLLFIVCGIYVIRLNYNFIRRQLDICRWVK